MPRRQDDTDTKTARDFRRAGGTKTEYLERTVAAIDRAAQRGKWSPAERAASAADAELLANRVWKIRIYRGTRSPDGGPARVVAHYADQGSSSRPLDARLSVRSHSPDGFQWGYAGSGPAQLALALCVDAIAGGGRASGADVARALTVYQDVKSSIVAALEGDTFELTSDAVIAAIELAERARSERLANTPAPAEVDQFDVEAFDLNGG